MSGFFRVIKERFKEGFITNNPTFIQFIGMCPTLATTTSAKNALGMGLAVTAVLAFSNTVISLLRKIIPSQVRIAAFIVIISGAVTATELLMKAFLPALNAALGIFIPLIVVNCIILARAEAFASKNKVFPSFVDGIAMGLGFTGALFLIGSVREIIGAGTWFGMKITPAAYSPATIFIMAPGAFFTLGILVAITNKIKYSVSERKRKKEANAALALGDRAEKPTEEETV
jgi:electron transport complex protein RnfE